MRQIGQRALEQGKDGGAISPARPKLPWLRRRLKALGRMEARLPAHAGLKATFLLFAATGIAGVISADRVDEMLGKVSSAAGLIVDNVEIAGQMETSEVAVLQQLQLPPNAALPFIDVASAKARIETLPWIQTATLRKVYPATLKITLEERTPYVLWQHDQTLSVLDESGRVIGGAGDAHRRLVRVVGEGAQARATEALALADAAPAIRAQLKAAVLVGGRRWNLVLDNGVTLMLPEDQPQAALARIANFDASDALLSKDIVSVDLRLGDRMFVRLTPDASERRQAAIKEQEKLAKRKGAST